MRSIGGDIIINGLFAFVQWMDGQKTAQHLPATMVQGSPSQKRVHWKLPPFVLNFIFTDLFRGRVN